MAGAPQPEGHPSMWPGHPTCHFLLLTVQPSPGSDQRDLIFSQGVGKAEAEGWAGWSPRFSVSQSHTLALKSWFC